MERLLVDAEKISGVKYDISNLNDVYQAIHVIQGELGITGTTALEASTTIQGSAASMKSAWSNLMTGLADDNADLELLISNFIDSVGTYASNLIPRIAEVMSSIGGIIRDHLPEIAAQISTWVSGLLDNLIAGLPDGFKELATAIKDGLGVALDLVKNLFKWIIDNGDVVISLLAGVAAGFLAFKVASVIQAVTNALQGMTAAQWLLNAAMNANPIGLVAIAIGALIAVIAMLILNWDTVKEVASKCWDAIKEGASAAWEAISGFFSGIGEWFSEKFTAAKDGVMNAWSAVTEFFSGVWESISGFFADVGTWFSDRFTEAKDAITSVFSTVAQWFSDNVVEPIKNFFQPLVDFFTTLFNVIKELAQGCWNTIVLIWSIVSEWFNTNVIQPVQEFFTNLWDGIKNAAQTAWDFIVSVWTAVSNWFNENVITPVKDFFTSLWDGIKEGASTAWNNIKEVWNVVSSWFNDTVVQPVSNFFTGMWDGLKNGASKAWEGIKSVFSKVTSWFKDQFTKAWTAVKNVFSTGGKIFDGIKEGITSAFKTVVNAIIKGINKVIAVPFNAINNILDKIRNVEIVGYKPFSGLISRFNVPQIPTLQTGIAKAKKGHQYLLEGKNDEAVIPLHKNAPWLKSLAGTLLNEMKNNSMSGVGSNLGNNLTNSNVNNFTQIINAPKSPSRIEIYRQTRNLLELKGGI